MTIDTLFSQKTLRLTLYSGIGLIVISMLFLVREVQTSSFVAQVALAVATPAFFYVTGGLVYRTLDAPLAAPGIVATGAWLVVVEMIHVQDQTHLLPESVRPYYWLIASLIAAGLITCTGFRARIWLLVPLVPLVQVNAMWAIMEVSGLNIAWWSVLSFVLVLAWWEAPVQDQEWRLVYRVSAVLLEVFLLIFSYWLPAQTAHSVLLTWVACAALVAFLSARHGWINLGPLALVLLACAVAWGLPPEWWPVAWLGIAAGTVIFIERLARRDPAHNALALEMSTALAVLLSGLAALLAKTLPFLGATEFPFLTMLVFAGSGALLVWIGWRRSLSTAEHGGLWLLAAGWAELYFLGLGESGAYGLWMSLLAAVALLVERLLISRGSKKRKTLHALREAVVRWPLADLVIGLTVLVILWTALTAMNIPANDPLIVIVTLAVVIGVWVVAGLLYRLPVLLHVALWLAPLPAALFLIQTLPPFRSLAMIGLAWQVMGTGYVLVGHALPRYRPAMLAPFFVAGYALIGIGLVLMAGSEGLLLVGLGLVVVVATATSLTVVVGAHPAWSALVRSLVPPEERPCAFKHIHNSFLFLAAWLLVIWLYLMMGYAAMSAPRQGIVLVLLSSAWIILGRVLPRLPGMVGWPVYAAGWFMWLLGLLQVFFSPTEAIITAIFGLVLSGEQLHRSREIHWMPVFILQVLFSALQIAWMLDISGYSFLLAVTLGLALAGMGFDHHGNRAGRVTALMGGGLSVALWLAAPNPITTLGLVVLAVGALATYRRWECLLGLYVPAGVLAMMFGSAADWRALLVAGVAQIGIGTGLVMVCRPRRFRTIRVLLVDERDWASPFLWFGTLSLAGALLIGWQGTMYLPDFAVPLVALAAALALYVTLLRTARLPYVPVWMVVAALLLLVVHVTRLPYGAIGNALGALGVGIAGVALVFRGVVVAATGTARPFAGLRGGVWWARPLQSASVFLTVISACVMAFGLVYEVHPAWFIVNCLLLAAITFLIFVRDLHPAWIVVALVLVWLAWAHLLAALGLTGAQWHTLPVGLLLLALARVVARIDHGLTELAGIGLLVTGGALDVGVYGLISFASVVLAAQLTGLAIYGWWARRRVPLLCVTVIVVGGVGVLLLRISPWLIPLSAGLLLLGGALVLEARRDSVEQWVRQVEAVLARPTD